MTFYETYIIYHLGILEDLVQQSSTRHLIYGQARQCWQVTDKRNSFKYVSNYGVRDCCLGIGASRIDGITWISESGGCQLLGPIARPLTSYFDSEYIARTRNLRGIDQSFVAASGSCCGGITCQRASSSFLGNAGHFIK